MSSPVMHIHIVCITLDVLPTVTRLVVGHVVLKYLFMLPQTELENLHVGESIKICWLVEVV